MQGGALAIVGSRNFSDEALFQKGIQESIRRWGMPEMVVTGGAAGADTMGVDWACEHNLALAVFEPEWKVHGKAAGPMRNRLIVDHCTHVLAFPSRSGRGTQNTMELAKKAGKPLLVYWID